MRTLNVFSQSGGSLIANFGSRMGDAIVRRRAEIEIRASRIEADLAIKARSEFLANMNHELRTPLNAIIGFATMLRDSGEYRLSEEQKDSYAEYILQSADLLLGHINTILEVASLESGSVEVHDEEVAIHSILGEALERAEIQANAGKVSIERRNADQEVNAWGDAERIGQAIDQVLQTAIRSCAEGGRILVRACTDDKGWGEIAVRDNGEGLTPEETKSALEAFEQVHRGLDRSFSGPGVGYAIAKTFVEMQGGRFFIKSRKGQGTLVRLLLPPSNRQSSVNPSPVAPSENAVAKAPLMNGEKTEHAA